MNKVLDVTGIVEGSVSKGQEETTLVCPLQLWTMVEQGLLPPLLLVSTDAAPVWSLLLSPCCEECATRTSLAGKCKPKPNTSQHFALFREDNSDLGQLPCPLPSPP